MNGNKIHLNLRNTPLVKSTKLSLMTKEDRVVQPISYDALKDLTMNLKEQLENGYPFLNEARSRATFSETGQDRKSCYPANDRTRKCARCNKSFEVDSDGNIPNVQCVHQANKATCYFNSHVVSLMNEATLQSFIATPTANGTNDYRSKKVYALDTEHVYTHNGLEVARVTLVDMKKRVVLDTHVLPKFKILDLNTKWSGIVEQDLENAITLEECQKQLFQFVNAETILIGHSLEADLKAMRLCHHNVVDTSVLFAKKIVTNGSTEVKKIRLRKLVEDILNRQIQSGSEGHCSIEDAIACIDLLDWKINGSTPSFQPSPTSSSISLETVLDTSGSSSKESLPATPPPQRPPPQRISSPRPLMAVQVVPFQGTFRYRVPTAHWLDRPYWGRCTNRYLMGPQMAY